MTPPDDTTLWQWLAGGFAGLSSVIFKAQNDKIQRVEKQAKADYTSVLDEVSRQRVNMASVFDKLDAYARRSEDRHVEILTALHEGLNRKADR
jgi:hypothetical protein